MLIENTQYYDTCCIMTTKSSFTVYVIESKINTMLTGLIIFEFVVVIGGQFNFMLYKN